jgi:trigger factor
MNITQESIDSQSALLKVKIEPKDYHQGYDKALNKYRRQLQLPGFRAGKVPMSLVKNRYGRAALADELNKVLNDSIQDYITEHKLKVLGSPIPSEQHGENGDWDNPADFEFFYELGLAPQLDVKVNSKDKVDFYTVKVDEKMLNDHILDLTERQGTLEETDEVAKGGIVSGEIVELDENGEVKPAGIFQELRFRLEGQDEETFNLMSGLKVGEKTVVDPRNLEKDVKRLINQLGVESAAVLHPYFQFTVKEIKWLKPAELNQDFYDKVFGEAKVNSEEEFKAKMTEDISSNFVRESDRLFKRDITRYLVEKFDPSLPDDFLKRWIRLTNEKPVTAEEIERDYHEYKRGLQWQLIFNEMLGNKLIAVSSDEVLAHAKKMLVAQYAQYGIPAPGDQELEASARQILAKDDQTRSTYDALYDQKLVAYFKENASVQEKAVSFDEFVELANN